MRRKYDERNKRNFIFIMLVAILIICVFSLFIYKYKHASKIQYSVLADSVVMDTNKNKISVLEDSVIKVRWNGNYYLIYHDNKINLGKNVIVYNNITGEIKLYGTFYEVAKEGNIEIINNETILENASNTKFYKIADREYLLVDRRIFSNNNSIDANEFLLVELDKLGNAKLSNNKLDLKTITETTLVTSEYTFDINNEILNFGKKDINLKKIIGSTNEYEKEEEKDNKGSIDVNNQTNNGNNGNGTGGNGALINNTGATGTVVDIEDLKDNVKMTSIIKSHEDLNKIDIDYVIYDPYNEYLSIYAEVFKPSEKEILYLSKNDNNLVINNLIPNTEYKIRFVYTVTNEETSEIEKTTFDELTLKTKKPEYAISVYKISKLDGTLTYKVDSLSGYPTNGINVKLSFDYRVTDETTGASTVLHKTIDSNPNMNTGFGVVDLSSYSIDKNTLMNLEIVSVSTGYGTIDIGNSYSFRYGV